jgi:hypothetical protein
MARPPHALDRLRGCSPGGFQDSPIFGAVFSYLAKRQYLGRADFGRGLGHAARKRDLIIKV